MAIHPTSKRMNTQKPFGIYLYKKQEQEAKVLKDMLQFLKSTAPGRSHSFSYIEAETSLHPHLSLWENLQIEIGPMNWKEFREDLKPEWCSLVNLIKEPGLPTYQSEVWEKFIVSLLKGLMNPAQNLLIDMNEELLSPFLIQSFKKSVLHATKEKTVFLASANSSLWLDCAHSVVNRNKYTFEIEKFDSEQIRRYWIA
jgi:ABC-type branched-subunit amino acid transport system ATPase component